MADNGLYSQTIDRTRGGHGWVNILGHDPLRPGEAATLPAMEPYKHFSTAEAASEQAAKSAQADYDKQRSDPNSSWYNRQTPDLSILPDLLNKHIETLKLNDMSFEDRHKKIYSDMFAETDSRHMVWQPTPSPTEPPVQVAGNVNADNQMALIPSGGTLPLVPNVPQAVPGITLKSGTVGAGTYENRNLDVVRASQAAQDKAMKAAEKVRINKLMGIK